MRGGWPPVAGCAGIEHGVDHVGLVAPAAGQATARAREPGRVRRRERPAGAAPLRFGLAAFVIARPDEDEAQAELAHLIELSARDDRSSVVNGTDKDVAMMKVGAGKPKVGTNGGTLAGLVGSYDQVAERVAAFHAAGIELLMLQFQPLEAEARRFAAEVIPRVRALSLSPA